MNELDAWAPATEILIDAVSAGAAAALHGLLDAPDEVPSVGEALPPLWHWLTFLPRVPQRELGPDGHPRRGAFLPPVSLPRRMIAGGRVEFLRDLRVGEHLQRISTVTSIEQKAGRSGHLVFVTVRHEITSDDGPAMFEEQDIVFGELTPSASSAAPPAANCPASGPARWDWQWHLPTDSTVLFRFSALTYNAHRIHYDRDYATRIEGYPGLVVHGPLQAIALAEVVRRHADRPLTSFSFRSLRPAFDGHAVHLRGAEDGGSVQLAAFDHRGNRTMEAEAVLGQR